MSGNDRAYIAGVTQVTVGLSAATEFVPPPGMIGGRVQVAPESSGGSLAIVGASTAGTADGYMLNVALEEDLPGPCRFFLAATGATMVASVMVFKSAGSTFG